MSHYKYNLKLRHLQIIVCHVITAASPSKNLLLIVLGTFNLILILYQVCKLHQGHVASLTTSSVLSFHAYTSDKVQRSCPLQNQRYNTVSSICSCSVNFIQVTSPTRWHYVIELKIQQLISIFYLVCKMCLNHVTLVLMSSM